MKSNLLQLPFLLLSCVGATLLSFDDYVASYEKSYKNIAERNERRRVYEQNVANIKSLNSRFPETLFGVNKFSDLSPSEFKSNFLLKNAKLKELLKTRNKAPSRNQPLRSNAAPRFVNWFGNATTTVRDQGQCGSCWAFSTVEQVESDWFLSGKSGWSSPQELSVQELVDCDTTSAYGCAGTYAGGGSGYRFIAANGGLTSESKYPYVSGKTGSSGKCKKLPSVGGKIKNFSYATKPCDLPWDDCNDQDEDQVAQYIATHGPLAICANARIWQYYKNGVMSGKACGGYDHGSLDHCVQLVGYNGYDAGKGAKASGSDGAYWIVRNSWATNWGQNGFIYLAMGNNTCGIADVPSFALV